MMRSSELWSPPLLNKITLARRILSWLSLKVREEQFKIFWEILWPTPECRVLDVGIMADETLPDSNFFEKRYPYLKNLTAVSIENCRSLFKKKYPQAKFIQTKPNKLLPFANKSFNIVVSWATLEHVGEREEQKFFLRELFRVGEKIFITTPDKSCFYEPHSGFLFAHWLPHKYFSLLCKIFGKNFWASKKNLNPLNRKDIIKILPKIKGVKIMGYKTFKLIPSHLIIVKEKVQ